MTRGGADGLWMAIILVGAGFLVMLLLLAVVAVASAAGAGGVA